MLSRLSDVHALLAATDSWVFCYSEEQSKYYLVCVLVWYIAIDLLSKKCIVLNFVAKWQVMCIFKAMHADPHQQQSPLNREEFFNFNDIQSLKWKQVPKQHVARNLSWRFYLISIWNLAIILSVDNIIFVSYINVTPGQFATILQAAMSSISP